MQTAFKEASVDFAFDHARPGLGIGFGFENFSLGWIALTANLRFPLLLANRWPRSLIVAIPTTPATLESGGFVAQTTFRTRTGIWQ